MREPRIMIIEPKLVNEILIKNFQFFENNEFSKIFNATVDPLLSRSPFLSRNESWREYRREIMPAFSSFRLKEIYPLIEEICENFYVHIISNINETFEARDLALRFTSDIVSYCIFNIESDCLSDGNCNIRKMSKKLSMPSFGTVCLMMLTEIFPALRSFVKIKFIAEDVEKFFLNFFERSIKRRKGSSYKVNDFLNYVLQLSEKKNLSHKSIAGHLTTFFSDGLESTSLLIAHTLYEVV